MSLSKQSPAEKLAAWNTLTPREQAAARYRSRVTAAPPYPTATFLAARDRAREHA